MIAKITELSLQRNQGYQNDQATSKSTQRIRSGTPPGKMLTKKNFFHLPRLRKEYSFLRSVRYLQCQCHQECKWSRSKRKRLLKISMICRRRPSILCGRSNCTPSTSACSTHPKTVTLSQLLVNHRVATTIHSYKTSRPLNWELQIPNKTNTTLG